MCLVILSVLFLTLLSGAVTLRRDKSILYSRVTIFSLIYCLCITLLNFYIWEGISLFGGLFHDTKITKVFQIFLLLISGIILNLTSFYPRKIKRLELWDGSENAPQVRLNNKVWSMILNKMAEHFTIIEYSLIIVFIIVGALLLMSSSDLVSIFLSIELQSYGLYLITTIYKNSELATRAGLTYFLLGGLSSCFILLGSSLLYANSGITNLDGIYLATNISNICNDITYLYKADYINYSLIILSVGFLFKVSAAPFHFWSPDVYDAIPTIVTTFVAIIAKISIFIFFLELVHYTGKRLFAIDYNWTNSLLLSSLLSLIIGTVAGLTQNRIKRLLAYSTISHIGFILLALSIDSVESIQAFIFYLIQYSITNLNAFIILIAIGFSYFFYLNNNNKQYGELEDQNNSPVQLTKQMRGYYYINRVLTLSLTITVFSFVGIPPLIGFFGKQMVLSAALDSGYIFLSLIAILTSVISAVYYLNIIKQLFFFKSQDSAENNKKSIYTMLELDDRYSKIDELWAKYYNKETKDILDYDDYIDLAYLYMLDYTNDKPAKGGYGKYGLVILDNAISKSEYKINNSKNTEQLAGDKLETNIATLNTSEEEKKSARLEIRDPYRLKNDYDFLFNNVVLSSYLTIGISVLSLSILLFIFQANELLNMANLLALNLNDTDKW